MQTNNYTKEDLIKSFEEDWSLKLREENGKWFLLLEECEEEEELEQGLYAFMMCFLEASHFANNKEEDMECLRVYNWYKEHINKLIKG